MQSVKAGAAHVAFAAPSRSAVQAFFTAALKAGGRIHGEPAVRDQETRYYSAAVLDFDNNSIEVTHRPKQLEPPKSIAGNTDDPRVLNWQKEVAKSTAGSSVPSQVAPSRVAMENVASPTMVITQSTTTTETKPKSEMSTKALIGTLLGAAAGAAVAYAMTKGEEESSDAAVSKKVTHQTIEAPYPQIIHSAVGSRHSTAQSEASQSRPLAPPQIEYPNYPASVASYSTKSSHAAASELAPVLRAIAAAPKLGTLIDTFIPPSEVSRHPPQPIARSHTDSVIQYPGSQVLSSISRPSKPSRASSAAITITPANFSQPQRSVVTEVKVARDVPLPSSRATSVSGGDPRIETGSVLGSVAPSDSVSQAGSKKSRSSRRSKRHSSGSRLRDIQDDDTHISERTARRESSKAGSKKESVVSMPIRPASKVSIQRSVKSFITGL